MNGRCTVFVNEARWRVGCVDESGAQVRTVDHAADADLPARARAAADLIAELGGDGPVVVALPSVGCLSATIPTADLARGATRRQAMAYLLEEQLPLSAEDATADYVEQQGRAMGVCAQTDRLRDVIEALSANDISVAHLCPAALLTAGHWIEHRPDVDGVLIMDSVTHPEKAGTHPADLIEIDRRLPCRWWWLTDERSLNQRLDSCRAQTDGEPFLLIGNTLLEEMPGIELCQPDTPDADQAAALHAGRILAGEVSAWIDLRRDALAAPGRHQAYRKHASLLAGAAALLLLLTIAVTYWRGAQYENIANDMYAEQADVFKQAFPDSRPPAGSVLSRLKSEQRNLVGTSGRAPIASGPDAESLYPTSALSHLHTVLTALPSNQPQNARYQISSLFIDPTRIQIDGVAANSVIPGQLVKALRQTGRYEVDPASPRLLADTSYSYGFVARPKAKPAEEAMP